MAETPGPPKCSGPFTDASDCPIHNPAERPAKKVCGWNGCQGEVVFESRARGIVYSRCQSCGNPFWKREAEPPAPPTHERVARLARTFAAEWARPSDPDHATEALVNTLSTAMLAFHACARGVEQRAEPPAPPDPPAEKLFSNLRWAVGVAFPNLETERNVTLRFLEQLATERATVARLEKQIAIQSLSVPLEDELSGRIDETLKYLAMEDGYTLAGIARLFIDTQRRMADDWLAIGSERRQRKDAEATVARLQQEHQLLADIRAEYAERYGKGACDECEQCGPMVMCAFHSLLSVLFRGCETTVALERFDNGVLVSKLRAAEAARETAESEVARLQQELDKLKRLR